MSAIRHRNGGLRFCRSSRRFLSPLRCGPATKPLALSTILVYSRYRGKLLGAAPFAFARIVAQRSKLLSQRIPAHPRCGHAGQLVEVAVSLDRDLEAEAQGPVRLQVVAGPRFEFEYSDSIGGRSGVVGVW